MQRLLITIGVILIGLGLLWPLLGRLGPGHLPGDIRIDRPGFSFFAPLGTALLISVALSLLLTLLGWWWRR